jgi:hypothetical protein
MKKSEEMEMVKYWKWFFRNGYKRFYDKWLLFHVLVSFLLAGVVPLSLYEASKGLLLPTVGILIGLSFAWSGNALALLSTDEIQEFTGYHDGGIAEYAYVLLSSILSLIVTLVGWGLAGLDIFDSVWPGDSCVLTYYFIKVFLYLILSVSIRECWSVVMGTQMLLLAKVEVARRKKEKNS